MTLVSINPCSKPKTKRPKVHQFIDFDAEADDSSCEESIPDSSEEEDTSIIDDQPIDEDQGTHRHLFNEDFIDDDDNQTVQVTHPCPKGILSPSDFVLSNEEMEEFEDWTKMGVYKHSNTRYSEYCER